MSWRGDRKKVMDRLKKHMKPVLELSIQASRSMPKRQRPGALAPARERPLGEPPDIGKYKTAIEVLEKDIASANRVLGRKPAQWAANKKRMKSLKKRRNQAQQVVDGAYKRLDALQKYLEKPQGPVQMQVLIPMTYADPTAEPEDELLAIVGEEPLDLEPLPPLEEESFIQRHPVLTAVGALVGVGAILGGVYYVATREPEED